MGTRLEPSFECDNAEYPTEREAGDGNGHVEEHHDIFINASETKAVPEEKRTNRPALAAWRRWLAPPLTS